MAFKPGAEHSLNLSRIRSNLIIQRRIFLLRCKWPKRGLLLLQPHPNFLIFMINYFGFPQIDIRRNIYGLDWLQSIISHRLGEFNLSCFKKVPGTFPVRVKISSTGQIKSIRPSIHGVDLALIIINILRRDIILNDWVDLVVIFMIVISIHWWQWVLVTQISYFLLSLYLKIHPWKRWPQWRILRLRITFLQMRRLNLRLIQLKRYILIR